MTEYRRPLSQAEIESAIMGLSAELESDTETFADQCSAAAEAEVDYKVEAARAMLAFAADPALRNVAMREARVLVHTHEKFRAYKITAAAQTAGKEALATKRARIDAMRTLAANVRAQT